MMYSLRRLPVLLLVVACAAGTGLGVDAAARAPARAPAPVTGDPELHLLLNVPGARLDVYERGERTHTYRVSVGLRGYETPRGEYRIRSATWNPWWHPPNSSWARGRKVERPGPKNPMGRVKLNFAPLLYIHGTPEYQALGGPASRGCIRMRNEDVIELARLVHRYGSPKLSSSVIDRLIASPSQTRKIVLNRPVQLTAFYEVADVRDGFLVIYPDVYRRVGRKLRDQVETVLEENGIDPRRVNRARLERLLEKGGDKRVVMSLDSLLATGDDSPGAVQGSR
jgi:murein L,D-transpeptidase YcbB/YkuD